MKTKTKRDEKRRKKRELKYQIKQMTRNEEEHFRMKENWLEIRND